MTHIDEFEIQLLGWIQNSVDREIKRQVDFMKMYYKDKDIEFDEKEFFKGLLKSIKYNVESDLENIGKEWD